MPEVRLIDGPGHGFIVLGTAFRDGEATFSFLSPVRSFALLLADAVPSRRTESRDAVYRMTDDESGTARFFCWADARPDEWPEMTDALCNASDDEILKLIDDLAAARKR